jgi:hypothetical protein
MPSGFFAEGDLEDLDLPLEQFDLHGRAAAICLAIRDAAVPVVGPLGTGIPARMAARVSPLNSGRTTSAVSRLNHRHLSLR